MKPAFLKILSLYLACFFLVGCNLAQPLTGLSVRSGGLQAWIDAPLDGTTLSFPVTYPVVCHGTDPLGVVAVEFTAGDSSPLLSENPDPGETLYTAEFNWSPPAPGQYVLQCRVQNHSGNWSAPALAVVEVAASPGSITITPTFTHTPTVTSTETSTLTVTSTLTPAGLTFLVQLSTTEFEYVKDCLPDPSQVTITLTISDPLRVRKVYLFYHLQSKTNTVSTPWNEGLLMSSLGSGKYEATVNWDEIPDRSLITDSKLSAWFLYQFVAIGLDGEVIQRSPVYSDITYTYCK